MSHANLSKYETWHDADTGSRWGKVTAFKTKNP